MAYGDLALQNIAKRKRATRRYLLNLSYRARDHMRNAASWKDRTGTARAALYASANIGAADISSVRANVNGQLELGYRAGVLNRYGVPYDQFLERMQSGKYAIVGPTADHLHVLIQRRMQQLWENPAGPTGDNGDVDAL